MSNSLAVTLYMCAGAFFAGGLAQYYGKPPSPITTVTHDCKMRVTCWIAQSYTPVSISCLPDAQVSNAGACK